MTKSRLTRLVRPIAVLTVIVIVLPFASAQPPNHSWPTSSRIQGAWCAQGDLNKRCSISGNGLFINLTNEQGSTSTAHLDNMSQSPTIVAEQWGMVSGALSSDGYRIDWSNGTYWTRCYIRMPQLAGAWSRVGQPGKSCLIQQLGPNLYLVNELGQGAEGVIDGPNHISTSWSGKIIGGTIRAGGNRIVWDNGTSWRR